MAKEKVLNRHDGKGRHHVKADAHKAGSLKISVHKGGSKKHKGGKKTILK